MDDICYLENIILQYWTTLYLLNLPIFFLESVLTSCDSSSPRGKISKAIVYVYVFRSSWFSSVVEEFENWRRPAILGGNVAINIYVTIVRQTINETL